MLSIETLKTYGANVEEGLHRCMGMESFYLDLVKSILPDNRIEELDAALAQNDLDKAFEIAHALKGMYANLALTPLSAPISEMTELLRSRTQMDYSPYVSQAREQKARLVQLVEA